MYNQVNKDIAELFQSFPIGTPVSIIHHPIKLGWYNKVLYLEVHPEVKMNLAMSKLNKPDIYGMITSQKIKFPITLNWNKINHLLSKENGLPTAISYIPTPLIQIRNATNR